MDQGVSFGTETLITTQGVSINGVAVAYKNSSGNLAIALTKLLSRCKITAIEISPAAVDIAKENARRHGVEDRIEFIQEDWSQFLTRSNDRADGIIANPPYIPSGEIPPSRAER